MWEDEGGEGEWGRGRECMDVVVVGGCGKMEGYSDIG